MDKKKAIILGAGESGFGSAVLADKKGYDVFVSDYGSISDKYKTLLSKHNIRYEEKTHSTAELLKADIIIKSPGISDNTAIIKKIKEQNIPVISEIEFAAAYTDAIKICITGSNGKTTTASLIFHILKKAGLNVCLAGNIGNSFAYEVATGDYDYYVLEISSFQLDNMYEFKAEVALLLNITPDHLDRYDNKFQNYIESKFRITQNQGPDDSFTYCSDDETIIKELKGKKIDAQSFEFTQEKQKVQNGAYLDNNKIIFTNQNKETMSMHIEDLSIQGKHNVYNSMAAGIVAHTFKLRKATIRESLMDFKNVEHRLEPVLSIAGVTYINDSKATNVNSAWYALESVETPIIWIAGGVDKGNDYSILNELVETKVKAIVCLGVDNSPIHKAFKDKVERIIDTKSMSEAVKTAHYLASKNDTVLLSPACASFDLFENYEDRGNQFKNAIRLL